jgi:hypothetical protein
MRIQGRKFGGHAVCAAQGVALLKEHEIRGKYQMHDTFLWDISDAGSST